jgi:hypothetical protein
MVTFLHMLGLMLKLLRAVVLLLILPALAGRKLAIRLGVLALLIFQAQPANRFPLTIDNIMRGPGLAGYAPAQVRWSGDSQRIFFRGFRVCSG